MTEIRAVSDRVASLGECPVWSGEERALYWEDIEGRKIHRFDPDTEATETRELSGRPGSFVLTDTPGELLVALETSLVILDFATGQTTDVVTVEDPARGNRLNDGRCDPAGRYIVGTMHPEPELGLAEGSLYSIGSRGEVDTLETEVIVPNGLVFDAARSRMYWTDTPRYVIWMWDYDIETGTRSNKRVFFDYRKHEHVHGVPDGACLDAEGFYWSASVYGWALTRIDPDGSVDRIVDLPLQKPSMPAFGGRDLDTLYVTTISNAGLTPSEPGRDGFVPGQLLALEPGVKGLPEPRFVTTSLD